MTHAIQQKVQSILTQCVEQDMERGAQVAVYHKGRLVVDAWAGTIDVSSGREIDADTLFPVFSCTKGIAATLAHILAERGKVSYDAPIAEYWPEFAANGKDKVTLRHALNHTAGVPLMPLGISHKDMADWDIMCREIAALEPVTPAGTHYAYHAITYSWTVGEVLRRVDGRPFARMLREEITDKLGISEGMYVGTPASVDVDFCIATLEANPPPDEPAVPAKPEPPAPPVAEAIPRLVQPLHVWMNRDDAHRACIPASNGIMSARALARHYAALLPGGVDGVEILPPERIRVATEEQPRPSDLKPEDPTPGHRLGYGVGSGYSATTFGHGGYGGSLGFGDVGSSLAFAFTRNRFADGATTLPQVLEVMKEAFLK